MSDRPDFQIERPFRLADWLAQHDLEAEPAKEVTYDDITAMWQAMKEATTPGRPRKMPDNWVDAPLTVENGRPVTARHLVDEGRFL